ncbi:2-hydroxyacid dehydrogenase [Actinoplanes sp. OR16]|uniref:hydroxyacid dehydrogenase n=1 Tax=Actinoplanes sp. OR16 TaxID=946334 RepID=UPI000F6E8D1D|nr:hydroxyacid dehydrogenase [Actinoplanes sp. OR16]BBH68433.1 2-hydroxyacid dehydrogenase [Actinoplanes sp. OR16]
MSAQIHESIPSTPAAPATPRAVLAMAADVADLVFPSGTRDRLNHLVSLHAAVADDLSEPALRGAVTDADLLITGWGCPPLDDALLDAAPRLRAILHAAGSVKEAGIPASVWQRGIAVSSAAEANVHPVVQFTIAAVLLAGKRAFGLARTYAAGGFRSYPSNARTGNRSRVVGVVGASRIGRAVITELCRQGFSVLVADPYLTAAGADRLGARLAGLDHLVSTADVVTLHAPELPETRGMIDDRRLALMRDGAVLINTARGPLVDSDALARHCAAGRIDAVLDVTSPEPLPAGHPLFALPNVFITPHIAGALGDEIGALGDFVVEEAARWLRGEPLRGLVTAADLARMA